MNTSQNIDAFEAAMRESGVNPAHPIKANGELQCDDILDRKPGNKHLRYQLHLDGKPNGWFQDMRGGNKITWKATNSAKPTNQADFQHFEAKKKQRQEAIDREHAQAAQEASSRFENASKLAEGHLYLNKKGVFPNVIKLSNNPLIYFALL